VGAKTVGEASNKEFIKMFYIQTLARGNIWMSFPE
jgi:hypothetical protein